MTGSRILPYIVWLVLSVVWGTSWGVIRIGLEYLPPLTFAAVRTVIAAGILIGAATVIAPGGHPKGRDALMWFGLGLLNVAVPYIAIFWAEMTIDSGLTAVVFATLPIFAAVSAHFFITTERLTVAKLGATLVGLVAVWVLHSHAISVGETDLWPVLAVMGAAAGGGLAGVLAKRHSTNVSTYWLTAYQVSAAAIVLVALAIAFERSESPIWNRTSIASLLYLSIVLTAGAYLALFWLLKRLSAAFVSLIIIIDTGVAVLIGAAFLAEPLSPRLLLGFGLMSVSVWVITREERRLAAG